MNRRRLLVAIAMAALGAGSLSAPASAGAFYANAADETEGAQLVSADYARLEEGDDTSKFGAISADGRYVAIQTRARNFFADDDPDPPGQFRAGGIFRFDLQTRAIEKVADGDLFRESDNEFLRRGASNPSISADGRFIAFSTAQQLVPGDSNSNIDVYVRDMGKSPNEPGAYTLASARNGGETSASYQPPAIAVPGGNPGADVSPGVAISADGTRVAFRTEADSDLPAKSGLDTPAGQVFVRDLPAQTTTLVTATRDEGTGLMGDEPAGGAFGAVLSADGTTVAWTGRNAPTQTRFLPGENLDPAFNYYLWRRAPFGSGEPTRRITGLADPDDTVCRQEEEEDPGKVTVFTQEATGPCFGPLTDQEGNRADITSQLPALSGDGSTVAFLTGSGPRPLVQSGPGLDLYVTDMSPGVSRKQGTVELTRDSATGDIANSSALGSVAMSSDGRFLALTTSRTQFLSSALQLVGSPRAVPGPQELYVVDLAQHTLERASHSISGGDVDGGVQDGVTLSADGSRVAFSSFAGNLFRGDANQRADVFVATRLEQALETPPPEEDDGGGTVSVKEDRDGPHVSVSAKSRKGGAVVLTISVPAAGSIEAIATARTGRPPKAKQVAERRTKARGKGSFHVVMRVGDRYRAQLQAGAKLRGRVQITFRPDGGGKLLRASTAVTFAAG